MRQAARTLLYRSLQKLHCVSQAFLALCLNTQFSCAFWGVLELFFFVFYLKENKYHSLVSVFEI